MRFLFLKDGENHEPVVIEGPVEMADCANAEQAFGARYGSARAEHSVYCLSEDDYNNRDSSNVVVKHPTNPDAPAVDVPHDVAPGTIIDTPETQEVADKLAQPTGESDGKQN